MLQGAAGPGGAMLIAESPLKIIKAGPDYDASLCWKM
jgi:ribose transport system substrate-binding protein